MGLQGTKLEKFAFKGKTLSLNFCGFRLFLSKLLRQKTLLTLKNLEVFSCAEQLLIVISCFLLRVQSVLFASLNELFKLFLGSQKEFNVSLLALKLSLKSLNSGI